MGRSTKKGPFVDERLMRRIGEMNERGEKRIINTWSRTSTIFPEMVGHTIGVHDGRRHIPVFVTDGSNVRREVASMPGVFQMSIDIATEWLAQRADEGFGAGRVVLSVCQFRLAATARQRRYHGRPASDRHRANPDPEIRTSPGRRKPAGAS